MAGVNVVLSTFNMRALGSKGASSEGYVVGNPNHRVYCALVSEVSNPKTPKLGFDGKSRQNQISEEDLANIVDIVRRSGDMEKVTQTSMSELADRLQRLREQIYFDDPGTRNRDQSRSEMELLMGTIANTPRSQIGHLRWSEVVDEGTEVKRFDGVKDSLPLTRNRGISAPSHKGIIPDSDKVSDVIPVRLVDDEVQVQPTRGDRGGRGHGAYRGGRGREGRGNLGEGGRNPNVASLPKTWAEVVNMPSRSPVKLRYIPPPPFENPNVVELPPRNEDLGKWESRLVGYFLDRKLPYNYVKNSVSNQWKNMGLNEVSVNGEGFMFFFFDNTDSCDSVLEGGPWYVGNQLLLLKRWKRMMKLTKDSVSQIPIWVKLFNVPMEYWDFEGLNRIASFIGTPLFMDHLTSSGTRISFAKVCVEVSVESVIPESFFVKCGDEAVEIRVEYQGIPAKYENCKVFGHNTKNCIKSQVAKLVQMQKETENEKEDKWKTVKAKGKKKIGEFLPPPKDGIIPGVSQEAPLKASHDELLGLAQVISPRASQIIEEVEREVLAAKSPIAFVEPAKNKEEQSTPTSSGSKKKKAAGKSSSSQRKKYRYGLWQLFKEGCFGILAGTGVGIVFWFL
ncbi:hypothetical protein ACSBR2_029938 [Camellia fascicularis]